MTVTMKQRQILIPVVEPVSILVMNFDNVCCHETQSAVCAPAVLADLTTQVGLEGSRPRRVPQYGQYATCLL